MMKFGDILLVSVFIACSSQALGNLQFDDNTDVSYEEHDFANHEVFVDSAGEQEAPAQDAPGPNPKESGSPTQGCGLFTIGQKYPQNHFMMLDLADFGIADGEDSVHLEDSDDWTIGVDVKLTIEPMSTTVKNGVTSELFKLDVDEMVMNGNDDGLDRSKLAKFVKLLDQKPTGKAAGLDDQLLMLQKFQRYFYYRMDCNGEISEVRHSQDDSSLVVEAKGRMANSFFRSAQGVEFASETMDSMVADAMRLDALQRWRSHDDAMEEMDSENMLDVAKDTDSELSEDDAGEEEEEEEEGTQEDNYVHRKEESNEDELYLSTEAGDAHIKKWADKDIKVEVPEAKQAGQPEPACTACQKSSSGLLAKGKQLDSQGASKCNAPAPKLANKVNQTCSSVLIARPRS